MNHIEINTSIFNIPDTKPARYSVCFSFTIDGKAWSTNAVDVSAFLNLLKNEKDDTEYYFWNCSCGIPDCANIMPSYMLFQNKDIIAVKIPDPVSYSVYDEWKENHKERLVKFDRNALKKELIKVADEIDEIHAQAVGTVRAYECMYDTHDEFEIPSDMAGHIRCELAKIELAEQKTQPKMRKFF